LYKVTVPREDSGAIFKRKGGNKGVRRGQADPLRTGRAENCCGVSIRLESAGFQKLKKREIAFDPFDIALEALEDFCHDQAREGHGRAVLDQAPEFLTGGERCQGRKVSGTFSGSLPRGRENLDNARHA
jgi:hypothetical protein